MKECNLNTKNLPSHYCTNKSESEESRKGVEDAIVPGSFMSVFSILLVPCERIDGNPIPKIIFSHHPSCFHAFVLGLNFAFCAGVMTIALRQLHPRFASICRWICSLSMLLSAAILVSLAMPWAINALLLQDVSPAAVASA